MSAYVTPIVSAILVFAAIAILVTVPWAVYQYRKYGYYSFWKSFMLATFIFYSLSAFFLVILPLPESRINCVERLPLAHYMQTTPFQFIADIQREATINWSSLATYKQLAKTPAFYQLIFNVLLLFPLGVYIRYMWKQKRNVWRAFVIGFFISLFFEVTQLTGLYGFYTCPYRLFDVDDLLANTTGAVLGFILAPLFLMFIPSKSSLQIRDAAMSEKREATRGAELLALFFDIIASQVIAGMLATFGNQQWFEQQLLFFVTLFVMIVVIPLVNHGRTLGALVVKIRYETIQRTLGISLLKRYIAIALPYILGIISSMTDAAVPNETGWTLIFLISLNLLSVFVTVIIIIHLVWRLLRRTKPFYFDHYSGTVALRQERMKKK